MMKKEKFKSTFAIIHLSDLHIVSHKGNYSIALHKMLDHIAEETKNISEIIIVFTGDLVEKGNFEDSEEVIYKFFGDLHKKLGSKVIDIVFVPGNHDKKRGILLLKDLKDECDESFWEKFKNEDWKYFSNQFSDFKRITQTIRKEIFKFDNTFDESYGMQVVRINQFNICFLCINSSWMCMDENDEGKLRVGRFQLDDLMSQYQEEKENVDLVIALMHHPTDWLTKDEQKYLTQYMTDEYRLNTNIMLQGHIHEKETYNWYNQSHSLTTLVTGMGWDQQKEIKDNGHRYSLYEINMDSSIIRVNTFVSDNAGKFNEDTEVYKDNNIIFPLFVHKYLEMNKLRFNDSEYPLFYPNYNIADNYENISNSVNKFSMKMISLIKDFQYGYLILNESVNIIKEKIMLSCDNGKIKWSKKLKNDIKNDCSTDEKIKLLKKMYKNILNKDFSEIIDRVYESIDIQIRIDEEKSEIEIRKILDDILNKYITVDAKNKFYSFIGSFCLDLQKYVFKKEIFDNNSVLRIHFRIVNINNKEIEYKKLFTLSVEKRPNERRLIPIENSELSDINFEDSMIEKSFSSGQSLLFSLNPSSNTHTSSRDWIDFLTIAPTNEQNVMKLEDDKRVPYLSFGISVNSISLQTYLRELAFIRFEKVLSNLLDKFFENSVFDINTLLERGELNDYE